MRVPVYPMRRLTFYFEVREKLEMMPLTRHISRNVSFRPQGAGYISGNTRYDEPPGFNWDVDYPYFDEAIWPGLADRVPAFEALKMTSAWAGHYDQNSFDNNAILGPWVDTSQPPLSIPLPVLPSMEELPPATAQLVWTLNRLGTRRDGAILASMYRHLAYWPAYLALAWTLIAPLDADGSLDRAIADASSLLVAGRDASFQNKTHLAIEAAGFGENTDV